MSTNPGCNNPSNMQASTAAPSSADIYKYVAQEKVLCEGVALEVLHLKCCRGAVCGVGAVWSPRKEAGAHAQPL